MSDQSIDAQFISDGLGGRRSGSGYLASCPVCNGEKLSINNGNNGKPVVNCWRNCAGADVIKSLQGQGLWPNSDKKLSPQKLKTMRDESEKLKVLFEKEKTDNHAKAATKAQEFLDAATGDPAQHPYAVLKGLPLGQRVKCGPWPEKGWSDALLIPLYDKNYIVTTISAINADGTKDLLAGGKMKGSFHPLGKITGAAKVLIGEGLATMAAAMAVGGRVAIPDLGRKADAWDMLEEQGADAIKKMIEAAVTQDGSTTTTSPATPTDWPTPYPLPDGLPPVKKLDPAMIPAPFRDWLKDIAHRMQSPVDFAAAAAIVSLASVIGRGCGIYPKRHDSWLVVPNLWGGVVGLPSVLKTPNIAEGMRHVNRLESEAKRQHEEETAQYNTESVVTDIQKKAICENIKKAIKDNPSADVSGLREELGKLNCYEPGRRRYQTQDGTPPKIGVILKENPRGILINRDELIGWFRNLDKTGNEADRGFHLEAWNGTGRYT